MKNDPCYGLTPFLTPFLVSFRLDAMDFLRVETLLGFKISCDRFANALNDILSKKGCCFRFTCYNADTDPNHITPGAPIHPVFRDP
jgi:hypothetical protein